MDGTDLLLRLLQDDTTTDDDTTTTDSSGLTPEQQASHDEVEKHPLHTIKKIFIVLKCSFICFMMIKGSFAYYRHPQLTGRQKAGAIIPMSICCVVAACIGIFDMGPKLIPLLFATQFLSNYVSLLTLTFLFAQVQNEQFQKLYKCLRIPLFFLHFVMFCFFCVAFIPDVGAYCTTEMVYPWIFEAINLVWTGWYILVVVLFCERHKLSNDYLKHEREIVLKMAEKSGDPKAIEKAKANLSKEAVSEAPDSAYNKSNIAQETVNQLQAIQGKDLEIEEDMEKNKSGKNSHENFDLATHKLPHPDLMFQQQITKFMCYMTVLMILKMFKTVIVNVFIREQNQIACIEAQMEWKFTSAVGDVFLTINIIFAIMQCVMCEQIMFSVPEKMGFFGPHEPKTCTQTCCPCIKKKDTTHLDGADQDALEMKFRQNENITIQQLKSEISQMEAK